MNPNERTSTNPDGVRAPAIPQPVTVERWPELPESPEARRERLKDACAVVFDWQHPLAARARGATPTETVRFDGVDQWSEDAPIVGAKEVPDA